MLINKRGTAYILACVLVLVFCMMLSVLMTFLSTITLVEHQNENTEKVLDSFVVKNAIEIYNLVKQGTGGQVSLDAAVFKADLLDFCLLDESGDAIYSYHEDGTVRFWLSGPFLTASVAADGSILTVTACYTMHVPLSFAGVQATEMALPVEIDASYSPRF